MLEAMMKLCYIKAASYKFTCFDEKVSANKSIDREPLQNN